MKTAVANDLPQAARWLAWVLLFVVSLWNCTPFVQAQSFTDVSRPLPDLFPGVERGSVAWADYDIDGRLDLLITGHTSGGAISKLFRNTGSGFEDVTARVAPGLPGVENSSVAWGDFDNDKRPDFLITGRSASQGVISRLYYNTPTGFVDATDRLVPGGLPGMENSSVAWGDYDNDGWLDFLIIGFAPSEVPGVDSGTLYNRLYHNIHKQNYFFVDETASQVPSFLQSKVINGAVAWGDYDNDNRLDFVYTGSNVTKLYHNTGSSFSEVTTGGLEKAVGLVYSSVAWGDYDNDNRLDLLITGYSFSNKSYNSKLYHNTPTGFVDVTDQLMPGLPVVEHGSVAWADYDQDGWLDLLITGHTSIANAPATVSKLYHNTGGNGFVDVTDVVAKGLPGVENSSVAWADYDGDGRPDFILTGYNPTLGFISKLYHNTPTGFVDARPPGVDNSSVAWADYDNDGRPDLLLMGAERAGNAISRLYHNTGGGFEDVTDAIVKGLPQLFEGSVTWADYDNDGQPDFLITGHTSIVDGRATVSKLYHNTPTGFVDVTDDLVKGLPQVYLGGVAWADYDGDGRPDFLITGFNGLDRISKLYHNTPTGFVDVTSQVLQDLPGVYGSSVTWADYDGDGWMDLLITGLTSQVDFFTRLYHNTNGRFEDVTAQNIPMIPATGIGSVTWADYDNDGRPDLLITGQTRQGANRAPLSRLYHNTPSGFVEVTTQVVPGIPQVFRSSVAWGDYNSDGWLDFLITGETGSGLSDHLAIFKLYQNTGGRFADVTDKRVPDQPRVRFSAVAWADFDNDKRLDFVVTGRTENEFYQEDWITRFYHNPCQSLTLVDQPASGSSVCVGANVSVSVQVSGTNPTYQWYLDGGMLSGQTLATLTLPNVQPDNTGDYTVVITGSCSSLTSTAFSLTVNRRLAITAQPASNSAVCAGGSISISVGVSGSNPTFQWYKDSAQLSGQTSASLSLTNLQPTDAGRYLLFINGSCNNLIANAFDLSINQGADLTLLSSARPSTLYGSAPFTLVVDVVELRGVATSGPISVKVTKDPKVSLSLPPNATSVDGRPVENSGWRLDADSNPGFYLLSTEQVIGAQGRLSFGLDGLLSPDGTSGSFSIGTVLQSQGGCETVDNNTNGERIDYFP